jgi:hypothetical protein
MKINEKEPFVQLVLNFFKQLDFIVLKQCTFFYESRFWQNTLVSFEYLFHGVPWFLFTVITVLCAEVILAKKASILFSGNF